MYRVIIKEEFSSNTPNKQLDLSIKTEKLFELLGRYSFKYGPGVLVASEDGITMVEHYKEFEDKTSIMVSITYGRYKKNGTADNKPVSKQENKHVHRTYGPHTPWTRDTTGTWGTIDVSLKDERLDLLVASGAVKKDPYN